MGYGKELLEYAVRCNETLRWEKAQVLTTTGGGSGGGGGSDEPGGAEGVQEGQTGVAAARVENKSREDADPGGGMDPALLWHRSAGNEAHICSANIRSYIKHKRSLAGGDQGRMGQGARKELQNIENITGTSFSLY